MVFREEMKLQHAPSDESLFHDVKQVVVAEHDVISQMLGSRTKQDKRELKRILRHLPVVREKMGQRLRQNLEESQEVTTPASQRRSASQPRASQPGARLNTGEPPSEGGPTRPRTPGAAAYTPRSSRGAAVTPQRPKTPGTPSVSAAAVPVPMTPRPGSSAGVRTVEHRGALTERAATPRRPQTPGCEPAFRRASTPPTDVHLQAASLPPRPGTSAGVRTLEGESMEPELFERKGPVEVTAYQSARLAELGIDPHSMSSSQVVNLYLARTSTSSYRTATREAERGLNARPRTPRSLATIFTPRAQQEVRAARSGALQVNEALDKWEVDVLADVCRSVRHFDVVARGPASEYTHGFSRRPFGHDFNRKPHVRPEL